MSTKKEKEQQAQEAIEYLKTVIKPGDTIYTNLKYVSPSGMTRRISVHILKNDDEKPYILNISWYVAHVLDWKLSDKDNITSIIVGGCGMDMGYHLVYSLSNRLFRNQFYCIGEGCPSNDHVNGNRDYTKHLHSDGGYALRQNWL